MKIVRDGREIKLTAEELIEAGIEYMKWCRVEDLESRMPEGMSAVEKRDTALKALPIFERTLDRSDSYWGAYWDIVNHVLKEIGVNDSGLEDTDEHEKIMCSQDMSTYLDPETEDSKCVYCCIYCEEKGTCKFACPHSNCTEDEVRKICHFVVSKKRAFVS